MMDPGGRASRPAARERYPDAPARLPAARPR